MSSRRLKIALLILACALTAARALDPVNHDRAGVAIHGYDPVAYFQSGKPVEGAAEWVHSWRGATWRFATEKNRDLFAADPERYAPQYGGYCAYAVSKDTTADIDPQAWKIVDGKLYLNYSPKIQQRWSEDIPGYIERADEHWPGLLRN